MALVASCLLVSCLSLNHLYPFCPYFSTLPTFFIGISGWSTSVLAIVYLGREYLRELSVVVVSFFILGFILGPFLEPPADPLEHLRRIHEQNCSKDVDQIARANKGMWQYSMAGVLLCTDEGQVQPETMLTKIDVVNGLCWALMAAALFILAQRAGLVGRWAFLSVVICFLFFGTNRFSYFRYYSLAPSASSLFVCWLWTASFFFSKNLRALASGLITALLLFPVLWVNHSQEAVFLGFILLVWIVINVAVNWGKNSLLPSPALREKLGSAGTIFTVNGVGLILLVVFCWVLPQFDFFRQWLAHFFIRDPGLGYQETVLSWQGLYMGGRISGFRVNDTLGMLFLPLLCLSVPYFWPGFAKGAVERKLRIFILAVLPFIGYVVPLFHFIWSSNVRGIEYYRLCYISVFWIFFADFFSALEGRVCGVAASWRNSCAENSVQRLQQ